MNKPWWLRYVVEPEGGMSSAASGESESEEKGSEEPDYRAKYEDMKRHSREWEKRAKENENAAKELAAIREEGKSELEKLQDKLTESEATRVDLQTALDRLRIGSEFGLSAKESELFLSGDADTMKLQAEALAERVQNPGRHAEDPNQGRGSRQNLRAAAEDYAKSFFSK